MSAAGDDHGERVFRLRGQRLDAYLLESLSIANVEQFTDGEAFLYPSKSRTFEVPSVKLRVLN
jgi:hypothetical protein